MLVTRCPLRIVLAALLVSLTVQAGAKEPKVNVLRIIRQHKVTVVTTEPPDKLQKYWLLWGVNPMPVMSVADFVVNRDKLPGDGDVIFIMDRSKKGTTRPEIEQLLPLPTAAVVGHEVLTYCSKTAYKRGSRYKNGWEILVSSPDEKWLHDELSHLQEILDNQVSESQPTKLHWFSVRRLLVVGTDGRQVAEDWIKPQFRREGQGEVFEWDFVDADLWTPNPEDTRDIVFLLNTEKVSEKIKPVVDNLPKDLQAWYANPSSSCEFAACKTVDGEREICAVVSPCGRQLSRALRGEYSRIGKIPESLARHQLVDLSVFGKMAIKVWAGGESSGDDPMLNDLASKLAAELQRANVGLEFISKQHAKLIGYSRGGLAPENVGEIRKETGNAGALVVLDLAAADTQTKYVANAPRCTTQPYPAFSDPRPDEPSEPNPEATILFKGKKYRIIDGNRRNDPHYKEDYQTYLREKSEYPEKIRRWEHNRDEYEDRRRSHDMDWELTVDRIQTVAISGNLHIYDMRKSSTDAGKEVFSSPFQAREERRDLAKTDHARVRGEERRPDALVPPESVSTADGTLVSTAFSKACREVVDRLAYTAILPSDRPDRVARDVTVSVTGERPAEVSQVTAEGEADASLEDAKDRAIAAALSNAVQQGIGVYIQQTTVGSNFEVIKNEILAKSGGFATLDEVISDSTANGIMTVKIRASVSNRPLADKLKALGLTDEWTVGVSLPNSAAELAIVQQLRDAGFRVLDDAQREKLMASEAAERAVTGDAKAMAKLRREFDVDILITGTAKAEYVDQLAEGGNTYFRSKGVIQAKALLTDTGKVLSTAATEAEGVDLTKDLAASVALADMGERVGAKLAEDILLAPAALEPFVTAKITGLKSAASASKLEEAFRDLPGVKQVKRQRYAGGALELGVYVKVEYWDLLPEKLSTSKIGKQLAIKVDKWTKSFLQAKAGKG